MRGRGGISGRKSFAWACAAAAAFALVGPCAAAEPSARARILYFEPFETQIDPRPALLAKRSNTRLVKFDAYGRRFELALEPNAALESVRASSEPSSVHLYRGQLTGIEGSWARIATQGSNVHGLIWDGTQLYVVEPTEVVRDSLVPPVDPATTHTVVFRLADTILDEGASLCAASTDVARAPTGRESYESLKRELNALKRGPALMQALAATLRLEISALGDAQFRQQFASDAAAIDQILLRLNNVDGIFAAELGVHIQVPTALVYGPESDPLPATSSATDLLRRLASHRLASPQLKARGLTHLFTGRDLDGATVGIGYIDSVCHAEFGVGLTEIRGRGAWLESLIAAHEIGHNFGAVHDGEEQCSSVPQDRYLMSPTVRASAATFSQCSLNSMMQRVGTASCITTLPPADLAIPSDLGTVHEGLGRIFEWELPVTNVGGRTSEVARIEALIPAALEILDAWIPGGTCTSGAGVVDCDLAGIAGGVTRTLHVTLRASSMGSSAISARIVSLTDARTDNNSGEGTIKIDPELDLGITLTAPASVVAGDAFMASFSVSNDSSDQARDVEITLTVPGNLSVTGGEIANGTCDLETLTCTVATLDAGATVAGSFIVLASTAGTGELAARVSAASFDPNQPNDSATQTVTVSGASAQAESPASPAATGKRGGGAFGLPLVLALLTLSIARRWCR